MECSEPVVIALVRVVSGIQARPASLGVVSEGGIVERRPALRIYDGHGHIMTPPLVVASSVIPAYSRRRDVFAAERGEVAESQPGVR